MRGAVAARMKEVMKVKGGIESDAWETRGKGVAKNRNKESPQDLSGRQRYAHTQTKQKLKMIYSDWTRKRSQKSRL